jgi:preprotein translocase subunit YajC
VPSAPAGQPQEAPGGGMSSMLMLLMFVPLILFLFWQSRSQQKKQDAVIGSLKKGDRVVTQSGLIGKLLEVDTRYAKVEIAPGVKVQVLRSALVGRDGDDAAKSSSEKSEKTPSSKPSEKPEPEKKTEK